MRRKERDVDEEGEDDGEGQKREEKKAGIRGEENGGGEGSDGDREGRRKRFWFSECFTRDENRRGWEDTQKRQD